MTIPTNAEKQSRVDFFIHPDYHQLNGHTKTDGVERYEAALHEKISTSELPILIHDPGSEVQTGDFWDRFPAEQRFATIPRSGVLAQDQEAKFNNLLEERQVIKALLHGSYLRQCVRAFRVRLRLREAGNTIYYHPVTEIGGLTLGSIPIEVAQFGIVLGGSEEFSLDESLNRGPDGQLPPIYAGDAQLFWAHEKRRT